MKWRVQGGLKSHRGNNTALPNKRVDVKQTNLQESISNIALGRGGRGLCERGRERGGMREG